MAWRKEGQIFVPNGKLDWTGTYATMPTAMHLDGDVYRVFYSGRDELKRAHVGYMDLDITNPGKILNISEKPSLTPGSPGMFDEAGVYLSWIQEDKYYDIGWSLGAGGDKSTPFRIAIGLLNTSNKGEVFERVYNGPILDRGPHDPGFVGSCSVLHDSDKWKMWYVSCDDWTKNKGQLQHNYNIKYAESSDGINWNRSGKIAINYQPGEYAIARPSVLKESNGNYKMWYCFRANPKGDYYRIGYAESEDGMTWERRDNDLGIDISPDGWDSEMVCYPYVFDHKGVRYMLYNGNGYGQTGFGYAILDE